MKAIRFIFKALAMCAVLMSGAAMAQTHFSGQSYDDFTKVRSAGKDLAGTVVQPLKCAANQVPDGTSCVDVTTMLQSASCPSGETMSGGNCATISSYATGYPWTHYFIGQQRCNYGAACVTVNSDGTVSFTDGYFDPGWYVGGVSAIPSYNNTVSATLSYLYNTCGTGSAQSISVSIYPTGMTVDSEYPTDFTFSAPTYVIAPDCKH